MSGVKLLITFMISIKNTIHSYLYLVNIMQE